MANKEAQINVRLPGELDAWLEQQAGGKRQKAAYIRALVERERARAEEAELRALLDEAWESLSPEERAATRAEREAWLGAYSGSKPA